MKIEIIDNFLSDYYADSYEKYFGGTENLCSQFKWFFMNNLNSSSEEDGAKRLGNYYFNNTAIDDYKIFAEDQLPLYHPLLNKLGVEFSRIKRIKANLYPRTQFRDHHQSHRDYPADSGLRTCLYYVNTNNRFTIFDGKRKVKSKKNRAIFFDGSNMHHSTSPTDCNWGCSINIDYKL